MKNWSTTLLPHPSTSLGGVGVLLPEMHLVQIFNNDRLKIILNQIYITSTTYFVKVLNQ